MNYFLFYKFHSIILGKIDQVWSLVKSFHLIRSIPIFICDIFGAWMIHMPNLKSIASLIQNLITPYKKVWFYYKNVHSGLCLYTGCSTETGFFETPSNFVNTGRGMKKFTPLETLINGFFGDVFGFAGNRLVQIWQGSKVEWPFSKTKFLLLHKTIFWHKKKSLVHLYSATVP